MNLSHGSEFVIKNVLFAFAGLTVVDEIMSNKSKWEKLFEPVNFFSLYK